jgi:hypothetical protein
VLDDSKFQVPILDMDQLKQVRAAILVAKTVLLWPLSSSEVERVFSVVKAGADARRSSMKAHRRFHETRLRLDLAVATGVVSHYAQRVGADREAAESIAG